MASQGEQKTHNQNQVTVVMIPLPAQGHLNPLLQLSHLISTYQIPVHYICSATHIRQAKVRAYQSDQPNSSSRIHFHDIPFNPNSSPFKTNPSSKFPTHLQRIIETSYQLRQPVAKLLQALSGGSRRIIVIHDSLMASVVQDVQTIQNAESYTFHTSSAFTIFFTIWELMVEKPFQLGSDLPKRVPNYVGCSSPEFEKFLANQYSLLSMSSGRLYNTSKSLEGKYMDLLRKLPVNDNKKLYAIGPIHMTNSCRKNNSKINHKCLDWLDKQAKDSVIYVSFGTTTSMSDEQITELAIGLEKSNQNFLWVLRDADKCDIFQENGMILRKGRHVLPEGYEEKVKNRGMVVRDWAPQPEILGHKAIAGFISHCGWNSCLESISMGVPIATWPIHSDQPKNSILITEVLKVGVVVKDWWRGDEIVTSSVVGNAIRRLMVSKEGFLIRKRARELGGKLRCSTANAGVSSLELDSFVAHITR
ncbi:hypothetical protein vseg_007687 [Gypsophila vaccaria]